MILQTTSWHSIKDLLEELLELNTDERQNRLKDLPEEVRAEVETLLVFEKTAENWNPLTAVELARDVFQEEIVESNPLVGQRIGNYEIVGELGTGGMGAVYLAHRADGKFEQKVALKMLRREFNIEEIRRHFKRESDIQAKLEHPFIARLLDVGTTDDGIPFFVMEYVEGIAVDKFCEKNNLDLNARLKLFNKICQAVTHAHRNLIIHRDLKPSNILVTEKGEPKLLDFGISKLLDTENAEEKTALTIFGAMTPEYASPEQVKGETVTTATDIYSLGVVLFKVLTSVFPYDFRNKTNGNLLREITDSEPISASEATVEAVSKAKISASELRGDLDNIIRKSLAKEPAWRYETVEQFSADIWRFIDGLPVSARPSTFSYRASKFFRRNKFSVIATTFVLVSLIGGISVALWQAKTARAAQTEAEQQFAIAKSEEEKSKKISNFMFKVFSYADPAWYAKGYKTGGQARVLDALEDLSGKIETEFEGELDIQAELHHRFAEVFGRVSSYDTEPGRKEIMREKANFHGCRGLELRRRFYGDWHELVAKDLYYSQGCIAKNEQENAAVWNKAIEIFRGTNPNNLNLPHLLNDYAKRLVMPEQISVHDIFLNAVTPPTTENKYQIAERYYREALPIFRQHYKENNLAIFTGECNLAYVLAIQEKWSDFDEHFNVCKKGEPEIKKHYSTLKNSELNALDLVRKTLAEKGVVR